MRQETRVIRPQDSPTIAARQYEKACEIASWVGHLEAAVPAAPATGPANTGLKESSSVWTCPQGRPGYGHYMAQESLVAPAFEFVDKLRLNCYLFTGYRLENVLQPGLHPSWTDGLGGEQVLRAHPDAPDWCVPVSEELAAAVPPGLRAHAPVILGETGWLIDGRVVNRDTTGYQERLALLHAAGALDHLDEVAVPRIVEIGGGYGALSYFLRQRFPNAAYYICDLPMSLFFSATYLSLACPDVEVRLCRTAEDVAAEPRPGVTLLPNYLFDALAETECHLAINTLSFAEMTQAAVNAYGQRLAGMLRRGCLFEQNFDNSHFHRTNFCEPKTILARYFPHRLEVTSPIARWGRPTLWSTDPALTSRGRMAGARSSRPIALVVSVALNRTRCSPDAARQGLERDHSVLSVEVGTENRLEGQLAIDAVRPSREVVQRLRRDPVDVVALPYVHQLYAGPLSLAAFANRFARAMQVEFPDGSVSEYRGDNAMRMQYTTAYLHTLFTNLPRGPIGRALEFGCSDGLCSDLVQRETGARVTGIDVLRDVGAGFKRASLSFARANGLHLPFPDATFDLTYSIATLEHVPDPRAAIHELLRVTKRGGFCYLQAGPLYLSPFGHHMFGHFDDLPWIHLRRTPAQIIALGVDRGLDLSIRAARGLSLSDYVIGMLGREHINGEPLSGYGLDDLADVPGTDVLLRNVSREGGALLTPEVRAELEAFTEDDLTAHGFELLCRVGGAAR